MKYRYTPWQITLIISTLINFTNTTHLYAMEVPTQNEQLLRAINTLPPEIQNTIVLVGANEFFLVAKALRRYNVPIKSFKTKNHLVTIQLYADEDGYHGKKETWNIHTGKLISSITEPYHVKVNHHSVTTVIASGYIHCNVTISNKKTPPKKEFSPLYLDHRSPEFNTQKQIFSWLKKMLTIPQADLVNRAYNAIKSGNNLTIYGLSEDGKIFLTFDKDVRMYLLRCLHIKLTMYSWLTAVEDCTIQ